eukprot:4351658-Lingulodinium_polyedra.AAC.1
MHVRLRARTPGCFQHAGGTTLGRAGGDAVTLMHGTWRAGSSTGKDRHTGPNNNAWWCRQ